MQKREHTHLSLTFKVNVIFNIVNTFLPHVFWDTQPLYL